MFYHLYQFLKEQHVDFPGINLMHYISFRTGAALIVSLLITLFLGKRLIVFLRKKQIGDNIRELGLHNEQAKVGTPTMGGILIIAAIIIPTILFAKLNNPYTLLMLLATIWMGVVGFIDDYIKVFLKNKEGLKAKYKLLSQVALGLIVTATLYFAPVTQTDQATNINYKHEVDITKTTIPFVKSHEFNYSQLIPNCLNKQTKGIALGIVYTLVITLIVTALSNAVNITDGIDGLATSTSSICGATLGVLAYLSGNLLYASYLNIMYLPNAAELTIFMGAFMGATIGFLWYNTYPAQIIMGDTGSLALGSILAVFAIIVKKELLLPLLCGIFVIENLSVIVQRFWFNYTYNKYGRGERLLLMSPIHHHFQKQGLHESKITSRFIIVTIILAVLTLVTLKIR